MTLSETRSAGPRRVPSSTALVLVIVGIGLALLPTRAVQAQTGPTYPELFRAPGRTDQLTQADVPNLARLVMLEASSMFVHARVDLQGSPESYVLLNDINAVWSAADSFVAALSFAPSYAESIEGGRLVFPQLVAAYDRLRATIGRFPGSSQRVLLNLAYMSRSMAVLVPLLEQPLPAEAAAEPRTTPLPNITAVRELARAILPLVQNLEATTAKSPSTAEPAADSAISGELKVLENLVAGLDWIAYGGADLGELAASVRPILSLSQQLDLRLQRRGLVDPMADEWARVLSGIDGLAAQFRLPRDLDPLAATGKPRIETGIIAPVNAAVNEIASLLNQPGQAAAGPIPGRDSTAGALQRLRTRLFILRQYVLGRNSTVQVSQAVHDVETAWQRVETTARAQRREPPETLKKLVQDAVTASVPKAPR